MQSMTTIDIMIVIMPSVLLGFALGYIIGEMNRLRTIYRIALSVVSSPICGVIISLLFDSLFPVTPIMILLSTTSVVGGLILGLWYNWTPSLESATMNHIVYEYDDDEFEDELERSLGRSE
jgi:hypothetical protein